MPRVSHTVKEGSEPSWDGVFRTAPAFARRPASVTDDQRQHAPQQAKQSTRSVPVRRGTATEAASGGVGSLLQQESRRPAQATVTRQAISYSSSGALFDGKRVNRATADAEKIKDNTGTLKIKSVPLTAASSTWQHDLIKYVKKKTEMTVEFGSFGKELPICFSQGMAFLNRDQPLVQYLATTDIGSNSINSLRGVREAAPDRDVPVSGRIL